MSVVVDTNVAIAANGKADHISPECELSCVNFLWNLVSNANSPHIVLDNKQLIMEEYNGRLSRAGEPGVGDRFFKHLHDNMYCKNRIILTPIMPVCDESRGFAELPSNTLDPNDRKFLAAAVSSQASIVNATDSDWGESQTLLDTLGVCVCQLCPD